MKMGIQKHKWSKEEEEALKAGVEKHGPGKWKTILTDPDFALALSNRSNIDLKVHSLIPVFFLISVLKYILLYKSSC